jgi:poly(A) polymerase
MLRDLAAAEWTRRAGLAALTAALGAENIRWVGGAVRDGLLGVAVHDVDCATLLMPAEVIAAVRQGGHPHRADRDRARHHHRDPEGRPVEITTLRRDVATDGRRATIAFARLAGRCRAARFHHQRALCPPETLEISDYSAGLPIWRRGGCGSSAMRASGLPRITCGSCAITAFRRASARRLTRWPKMPAPNLPTR